MRRWAAAAAATLLVLALLDGLWLGLVARDWYQAGLGHLMAEQVRWPAALAFYALYGLGLMVFAVRPLVPPAAQAGGSGAAHAALKAAGRGALFGLCAYGTYDLTNLATLRDWPLWLSLLDMAWGSVLSAASAAAGAAVAARVRR